MNIPNSNIKKIVVSVLALIFLMSSASAYQYFFISETLSDEVTVTANTDREKLQLSYVQGRELGGEEKEIEAGEWEDFQIYVNNKSSRYSPAWENVLIRSKFYGIEPENTRLKYKHENAWNKASVYDLRSLELGQSGVVSDLGPTEGYTIEPETKKIVNIRIKIDRKIENMGVEFKALTNSKVIENFAVRAKDPEDRKILNPKMDTYVDQQNSDKNYSEYDYLELKTQENNRNSYTLITFDRNNISNEIKSAKLNLYQYWGYGFAKLRESEVTIQIFEAPKDLRTDETITWESIPKKLDEPIDETEIIGTKKWYSFDLTKNLEDKEGEIKNFLIKFSKDDFDETERRIRFDSTLGEKNPFLTLVMEN